MNQLEFARIHEMQFHGDIRFHLRLHEMTKEPLWPEPVPPHWHEEYEFLVITRGTGTACLNTRTMHIEPGDILFINAGLYTPLGEMKKIHWLFMRLILEESL